MIEKAARSIYESRNGHGCKPWSLLTRSHKEAYLTDARAMFKAIRDPLEPMSVAGGIAIEESMFNSQDDHVFQGAAKCWQAMVDNILAERELARYHRCTTTATTRAALIRPQSPSRKNDRIPWMFMVVPSATGAIRKHQVR